MASVRLFVPAFALSLALLLPLATGSTSWVTVTLEVRETHLLLDPTTVCDVQVEEGSDAGAVLDAAVADGCISGWDFSEDPQFGRFVTAINGKSESAGFYWAYLEGGRMASHGIDLAEAREGDVFGFAYSDYVTGIAAGMKDALLP